MTTWHARSPPVSPKLKCVHAEARHCIRKSSVLFISKYTPDDHLPFFRNYFCLSACPFDNRILYLLGYVSPHNPIFCPGHDKMRPPPNIGVASLFLFDQSHVDCDSACLLASVHIILIHHGIGRH